MFNSPNEKFIVDAVNKYSDTVFRVAYQYTKDSSDAEDIVQEVFLKLFKTPPPQSDDEWLKAWLIRVAINKSKDFLRSKKRRRTAESNYIPPSEQPTSYNEVFEALAQLSERDRNALYLHYYEGYTAREVARILGGSERAMTKRICRAREKLKKFLEE